MTSSMLLRVSPMSSHAFALTLGQPLLASRAEPQGHAENVSDVHGRDILALGGSPFAEVMRSDHVGCFDGEAPVDSERTAHLGVVDAEDLPLCLHHGDTGLLHLVDDCAELFGVLNGDNELADVMQQPPCENLVGVAQIRRLGEHSRGHGATDAVLPEAFLVEGPSFPLP